MTGVYVTSLRFHRFLAIDPPVNSVCRNYALIGLSASAIDK